MPTTADRLSIAATFDRLRARKQIALMPFIPAGFPNLKTSAELLPVLEQAGANIIEIGIPFSDPIADGPVIQEAFVRALEGGLKLDDILETIAAARSTVSIPLVAMISYSIVFRRGLDRFLTDAKQAGFDGLILPDLPPPEAQSICEKTQSHGLDTILLVAPTTPSDRRKQIAQLSSGFVYYLSLSGITGERDKLPPDLESNVRQLKSLTDRPVCVGFGISTARHVAELAPVADGAIVGSAFVRRIKEYQSDPQLKKIIGDYCRELLSDVREST